MEEKLKMVSQHKDVEKVNGETYMGMTTFYVYLKNGSYLPITDMMMFHLTSEKLDQMIIEELKKI